MMKELLNHYGIDQQFLSSIKKRIYVVGNFNSEIGFKVFRFSSFDDSDRPKNLNFSNFIETVRPTLSETYQREPVSEKDELYLPKFTLSIANSDTSNGDGSYLIDNYNYFFLRATSSTRQEYYKSRRPKIFNLLNESSGETIYRQIRKNLQTFCSFQSKVYSLLRGFSKLLSDVAGEDHLSAVLSNDGIDLPVNFTTIFIDYLYLEGSDSFSIEGIDFKSSSNVWHTAMADTKFPQAFEYLVTSFKSYLIFGSFQSAGTTIKKLPEYLKPGNKYVSEELREAFFESRDAYNMLGQIIRSKVLLSMVLQWCIDYFKHLPSVAKEPDGMPKNMAIEAAIMGGLDDLAKPTGITNEISINEVVREFRTSFKNLVTFIVNPSEYGYLYVGFSDFVKYAAERIRSNSGRVEAMMQILEYNEVQRDAVLNSLEDFMVDSFVPNIFKKPGLTEKDLQKKSELLEYNLFFLLSILNISENSSVIEKQLFNKEAVDDIKSATKVEDIVDKMFDAAIGIMVLPEVKKDLQAVKQAVENINTYRGMLGTPLTNGALVPLLPAKSDNEKFEGALTNPAKVTHQHTLLSLPTTEQNKMVKLLAERTNDLKLIASSHEEQEGQNLLVVKPQSEHYNDSTDLKVVLRSYYEAANEDTRIALKKNVDAVLEHDIKTYNRDLSKIFERYNDPAAQVSFKNEVEALTLTRLLLINKKEINLGKDGTNLYDLLIDMVEKLDPDHISLQAFFKDNSLTKYVPQSVFNVDRKMVNNTYQYSGSGFSALERVLKNQADNSLKNVVSYVSELCGIKYLFENIEEHKIGAEVIVINGNSDELLNWLEGAGPDGENNLLDTNSLLNRKRTSAFPALVFLTDLAFNGVSNKSASNSSNGKLKQQFLDKLQRIDVSGPMLIPPILLSTSAVSLENPKDWTDEATSWLNGSVDRPYPLLVVGPPVDLNEEGDTSFRTTLSSGYIFCTHILTDGEPQQLEFFKTRNTSQEGRFRTIGDKNFRISDATRYILDASNGSNYAFFTDYYLYLISLLRTVMSTNNMHFPAGIAGQQQLSHIFYNYFIFNDKMNKIRHEQGSILNDLTLGFNVLDFELDNKFGAPTGDVGSTANVEKTPLSFVRIFRDKNKSIYNDFHDIAWFNVLRSKKPGI